MSVRCFLSQLASRPSTTSFGRVVVILVVPSLIGVALVSQRITHSGRARFRGSDRNVGLPGIRSPRRRLYWGERSLVINYLKCPIPAPLRRPSTGAAVRPLCPYRLQPQSRPSAVIHASFATGPPSAALAHRGDGALQCDSCACPRELHALRRPISPAQPARDQPARQRQRPKPLRCPAWRALPSNKDCPEAISR